jgi:hypothetical protein
MVSAFVLPDIGKEATTREQRADYPAQATNLMTMKTPTAITAVSAQDIPTRIAICMRLRSSFMLAA